MFRVSKILTACIFTNNLLLKYIIEERGDGRSQSNTILFNLNKKSISKYKFKYTLRRGDINQKVNKKFIIKILNYLFICYKERFFKILK